MKKLCFLIIVSLCSLISCSKKSTTINVTNNKILLVKVDYLTNSFEGGQVLSFSQNSIDFTTSTIDTPAIDFGSVKIMYNEINEPIFHGTIHWMGLGKRTYPQTLMPASSFTTVTNNNYVAPINGFENIYPGYTPTNADYMPAWVSAQSKQEIRNYLNSNPNQVVKVFLYTPSVGVGNPADWDWYFFLKL